MLQAWLSIGYVVLLAILVLAFILWRREAPVLAIAALVVGIPLWFGWEYARPTWTTGVITGTEVRHTRQYDRLRIHLHAQPVRQGARADQRRFLVVVKAQPRARLQRRQDCTGSQHGSNTHVESVALHAVLLVPQRDRHRPRRLLAVVVCANHHLLRPLRRPLDQLFLRLLQAAPINWRLVMLRNLGFVVSFALILVLS